MGRTMKQVRVTKKRERKLPNISGYRKKQLRGKVLERDGYVCQKCNQPYPETNLEADHIIPLSQGGEDRTVNMQTLCIPCHAIKTKGERNEQEQDSREAR